MLKHQFIFVVSERFFCELHAFVADTRESVYSNCACHNRMGSRNGVWLPLDLSLCLCLSLSGTVCMAFDYGTSDVNKFSRAVLRVIAFSVFSHMDSAFSQRFFFYTWIQRFRNLRILCEKYLKHQQDLYHVFIDFKKAFEQGLACSFVGNHEEVQH